MAGLIGRKIGMTRVIPDDGKLIPITVISVPDATVTQVKTVDNDGYNAVVLGIEPLLKPTKTKKYRLLKEFLFADPIPAKGSSVGLDLLKDVKEVIITAKSKGRGFTGPVKRHHFKGFPGGHAHSGKAKQGGQRATGSVGARAKPGRIKPGKRMAGQLGNATTTRHHVQIVSMDPAKKVLALKGPIPGGMHTPVYIKF